MTILTAGEYHLLLPLAAYWTAATFVTARSTTELQDFQ